MAYGIPRGRKLTTSEKIVRISEELIKVGAGEQRFGGFLRGAHIVIE